MIPAMTGWAGVWARIGSCERSVTEAWEPSTWPNVRTVNINKQVAIKLVNPPHGDRHFLRRFLRERQVLAGLEHPNVVRLLDGGATENGLPYLVLEHVEGMRIDTWCETRKLAVRDCVRLFRNVCAAVEYAHRKEVIHLDIKPGNILVTADGVPKLLDFGVARVLNPERSAEITETSPGPRPMTPEYASPEQARGEPVGPATDIYALGLVLYRLLTGHLPLTPGAASVDARTGRRPGQHRAEGAEPGARRALRFGGRVIRRPRPLLERSAGPGTEGEPRHTAASNS